MAGFIQALSATTSGTTSAIATLTATPSPGSLVIMTSRIGGGGGVSGAVDSRGNTWRSKQSALVGASTRAVLFWTTQDVAPLVTSDTVTITQTAAAAINGEVYEFSPVVAVSDVDGANTGASVTSLVCPVASLTTTYANEVVITVLVHSTAGASAWSINNSFTINDNANTARLLASKVTTAVGDQQATWSWTGALNSAAVMVAFSQGPLTKGTSLTKPAVARAANF